MEKVESKHDRNRLRGMLEAHLAHTGSKKAEQVLAQFEDYLPKFKKIIPGDYKRIVQLVTKFEEQGMSREEAEIEAFYANTGSK